MGAIPSPRNIACRLATAALLAVLLPLLVGPTQAQWARQSR